jgi:hypothetical protein
MTYEILGNAIKCRKCSRISHNPNDIKNLYCGHCHYYHESKLSATEVLYSDVFGNGFIYDIDGNNLSPDALEFHKKVSAGKWIVLRIVLHSDTQTFNKMHIWAQLFDDTVAYHDIGTGASAFFTQKAYPDTLMRQFKGFLSDKVLVF